MVRHHPEGVNVLNHLVSRQLGDNVYNFRNNLFHDRLRIARNLYKKDLVSHYGCVNAIEFSLEGELLVSGKYPAIRAYNPVLPVHPSGCAPTCTYVWLRVCEYVLLALSHYQLCLRFDCTTVNDFSPVFTTGTGSCFLFDNTGDVTGRKI